MDGTLNAGDSSTAYGKINTTELVCKNWTAGPNRISLLTFDLTEFTDSIKSAKLELYGYVEKTTPDTVTSIPLVVNGGSTSDWKEDSITWANNPVTLTAALDTIQVSGHNKKFFYFDVADYLRKQKAAGKSIITLVVNSNSNYFPKVIFNSKENPEGKGPNLIIIPHYQILTFIGKNADNIATLNWTTVPGEEYKKVILQRYSEGDSGVYRDLVSFNNNSSSFYSYMDTTLKSGIYTYRVKIINKNGSVTLSELIYIDSKVDAVVSNETNNEKFYLTLPTRYGPGLEWSFYNILGQETKTLFNPDPYYLSEHLSSGIYFFRVYNKEEFIYSGKLLIAK